MRMNPFAGGCLSWIEKMEQEGEVYSPNHCSSVEGKEGEYDLQRWRN